MTRAELTQTDVGDIEEAMDAPSLNDKNRTKLPVIRMHCEGAKQLAKNFNAFRAAIDDCLQRMGSNDLEDLKRPPSQFPVLPFSQIVMTRGIKETSRPPGFLFLALPPPLR